MLWNDTSSAPQAAALIDKLGAAPAEGDCKLLPACLGPCNKQIMLHPGENICTFDAINMTLKEYLMYLFKCQLLKEELYA